MIFHPLVKKKEEKKGWFCKGTTLCQGHKTQAGYSVKCLVNNYPFYKVS